MDTLAEKLNTKLQEWQPDRVDQVRQWISEIINLADEDALDILNCYRSKAAKSFSVDNCL